MRTYEQADILLSTFRNAKTPRNDDSSCFAKLLKLTVQHGPAKVTGIQIQD